MDIEGAVSVQENGKKVICHYWVRQYDGPSGYGIDEGRISKLIISREGRHTCNYDRGWDIRPEDEATQTVLAMLIKDYN